MNVICHGELTVYQNAEVWQLMPVISLVVLACVPMCVLSCVAACCYVAAFVNYEIKVLLLLLLLPTGTSFPGDRKLAKCRSVSGMVTTGTQKQSTRWSDIQH